MNDLFNNLEVIGNLANHTAPVAITLGFAVVALLLNRWFPTLHYINLVAKASTDEDVKKLAKYLATRNGGKHIKTDELWEAFVPAAKAIIRQFEEKKTTK